MTFTQYYLDCLSEASPLIADRADFVAGNLELAAPTGAGIGFGRREEGDFPVRVPPTAAASGWRT